MSCGLFTQMQMVAAFHHYKSSCTHSFVHLFNYFFVVKSSTWTCWGHRYAHFSVDIMGSGLPRWCSGKESASQRRRHKISGFDPWVGTILWNRKWQPTPVLLPGKFHGQRNLEGYSPQHCRVRHVLSMHIHCRKILPWL